MLLPSDIARLVLGYLQQEGLTATSRAFILESLNLKEYAEHSSEDGVIPACVFSLFGKNLITILNEYVAIKAKETSEGNQIPVVMASLWKKLDFTLNQIKSMQNSPAVQLNQRLRTLNSIQYMRHQQRSFISSQSPISGHLSVTPGATLQCVPSSVSNPQGMLGHSTPVSYTSQQTRPSALCLSQPGESPLQILVPDHRLNPGPLSPARRKCDSPRRRGGGQSGTSGPSRSTVLSSTLIVETPSEETTAENLSQIVIENAREKILNDRSLQEKLAENINKILASDNSPQTSKAACTSVEQEQSIDEILGLQGEIHMTDDAIQDILTQTESDPAFQALFDLFDCGKNKTAEGGEQADGSLSTSAPESDETGHINSILDSAQGTGQDDSTSVGENGPRKLRSQNTSDSKNKNLPNKSSAIRNVSRSASAAPQPRAVKPTAPGRGTTNSKRGLVRSRVLSGSKQTRGATSTTKSNNETDSRPPDQTVSSSSYTEEGVAMEIDDPQNETSETVSILIPELVPQESFPITRSQSDQTNQVPVPSQPTSIAKASVSSNSVKETGVIIGMTGGQPGQNGNMTETSVSAVQSEAMPSIHLSEPVMDISTVTTSPHSSNKMPLTPSCPQQTDRCVPPTGSVNCLAPSLSATTSAPSTSMCVSDALGKESDPSKIVSLKIIISDEQDVQSGDVMLNQAVSSITSDRIPTIFLSSPAKSPAKIQPTASAVITQEETAQAVSSLQGVEGVGSFGTPTRSVPATVARPSSQETGFIQLLPANPSFGPSGSYFVVTDPAAAEQRSNVVLLPSNMTQGTVSSAQHVVATPPRQRTVVSMAQNVSQTYSPGSTIIISSPVQPMLQNVMVPVSVMGQNTGKLTVLPNQMLSLPCSASVRPSAKVISQPKLAPKENTDTGKTATSGSGPVSKVLPQTSQSSEQQKSASESSPSHRRILCFDSKPENTTAAQNSSQTATPAETSPPTQHLQEDDKQTEPNRPLVSGTSKRRIETIRLLSHNVGNKDSEICTIPQPQIEGQKPKVAEKKTDLTAGRSSGKAASETESQRLESQKKSQPSNKDDTGAVSQSTKSSAPGQKQNSAGNTKDTAPEEPCEKNLSKPAERSSDKISLQVSPGVTANKENELKGSQQEQRQTTAQPPEGLVSSAPKPATPVSSSSNKTVCKTSPLTKQAAEMLHDIQGQVPAATTPKRPGSNCPDIPLPRTPRPGCTQEEPTDGLKTPSRQRPGRQGEGTPRYLPPPVTPDIPSCSPASEAGSENSINMAAHTLMILSRAARTGGPLKDSLRQEEAATGKSPTPKSKKRKHMEASPLAKKELQLSGSSGSKKKSKKQKKLLDSFPDDLDVDKFLSSLHYDE